MPIDTINLELRELGKLKLGEETADRPRALDTWRLVSRDRNLIRAAYQLYGGNPRDNGDGTFEVITETADLEVLIPRQDVAANQWFEHWQAGGLQRRCTGTALIEFDANTEAGYRKIAPCLCDEENAAERTCKPTTVIRVVLPELPDVGIWRLTTKSIYAARELPGVIGLILSATTDLLAPAVLGIDSRTQKAPGQPPHHFKVPVIRSQGTIKALLAGSTPTALETAATTPQISPPQPQNSPEEPPNPDSGPTPAREPKIDPIWANLGALLNTHTPDQVADMTLAQMIYTLEELERAMVAAHLWPEGRLQTLADKWLGPDKAVAWRDSMGHDIKAFTTRAIIQATHEVEATELGKRALASTSGHRQKEEDTHAHRQNPAH